MAWTSITSLTSWQDLAIAQEIAAFHNRIARCFQLDEVAEPDAATRVYDFVSAMQAAVTASGIRQYAVDPAGTFTGHTSSDDYPEHYASLSARYTAAGIASGFRRIPEGGPLPADWTDYDDPAYSYGAMQDKDAAGPWLYKDLQLMLSALSRHTLTTLNIDGTRASLTEINTDDPLPSYPTTAFSWENEASPSPEAFRLIMYYSESMILWSCAVRRWKFATNFGEGGDGLGDGVRDVDFIGRRLCTVEGASFWSHYGSEQLYTAVLYSVNASSAGQTATGLIGDNGDGWANVFPLRPSYPEGLNDAVAFSDMIALLKFDP